MLADNLCVEGPAVPSFGGCFRVITWGRRLKTNPDELSLCLSASFPLCGPSSLLLPLWLRLLPAPLLDQPKLCPTQVTYRDTDLF